MPRPIVIFARRAAFARLTPSQQRILEQAIVDDRTAGPLLRNRAGNALTTLDARRMVDRIAVIAGCRHITPHGL